MKDSVNPAAPLRYFLDQIAELQSEEEVPDSFWPGDCLASTDEKAADKEAVQTLLFDCDLLMESAAEHGWCMHRCFEGEVVLLAAITAARTTMECVAIGLWLLDEEAGSSERIRRSLIRRSEDVLQQRRLVQMRGDNEALLSANERLLAIGRPVMPPDQSIG